MIALIWLKWWYGAGWADCAQRAGRYLQRLESSFSIGILLRTLFAPWKQIVSINKGSVDDRAKAVVDNLISRLVGFIVRIIALISAAVILALGAVLALAAVIAWPLLPFIGVSLIVRGVL